MKLKISRNPIIFMNTENTRNQVVTFMLHRLLYNSSKLQGLRKTMLELFSLKFL